jgi:hypothetical protein
MAQAVSSGPPTAEARVRAWVSLCEICGEQNGTETGFSPRFSVFPVNIIIPPGLHTHISSSRGRTVSPLVAAVRRHNLTPLGEKTLQG